MKKTPWYFATQQPTRKGWYEVFGCLAGCTHHYWNGKEWGKPEFSYPFQPLPWRGLTKEAK
jgi:hypothetical protein